MCPLFTHPKVNQNWFAPFPSVAVDSIASPK
jgi:hypothetical protein